MPTWDYKQHNVITAKDIAEAIRFRKDRGGFAKAIRQVKHWTANGLLQTITPLETGRGVAREYVDIPTIFIAAVLQELTLFGLTVESLKPIADQLYEDYDEGDPYDVHAAAETGEFKAFLNIELAVDTRGRLTVSAVHTFSDSPDHLPLDQHLPQSSGSIMLNVLKIAERISWPESEDTEAGLEPSHRGRT